MPPDRVADIPQTTGAQRRLIAPNSYTYATMCKLQKETIF